MITIKGDYKLSDIQKAQKLHFQTSSVTTYGGYIALGIIVLFLFVGAIYAFLGRISWFLILYPSILLLLGLLYENVLRPNSFRKQFKHIEHDSSDLEMTFSDRGIVFKDQTGLANVSWNSFRKWKEDREMILLYFSDFHVLLLPKRLFQGESQANYIHELLTRNSVPVVRKVPDLRKMLLMLILIIVAFTYTLFRFLFHW